MNQLHLETEIRGFMVNKGGYMNEEVARTRIILDKKIEERFPLNYDAIQELAEKASELFHCLFVAHWNLYKGGQCQYVEYVAFREVLVNFDVGIMHNLLYRGYLGEFTTSFLAYRLLFNLISNDNTKLHARVLNQCNDRNKAWELFKRIEYLINNFETEILLPDM